MSVSKLINVDVICSTKLINLELNN